MRRTFLVVVAVVLSIVCQRPGAGRVSAAQDPSQAAFQVLERYSQLLAKGSEEIGRGRYAEAQKTLEEAVRINPGNPWAHHQLAQALYFQGRVDEAIRVLVAINGTAETARGHIDLAFFYLRTGDPARALTHAKRAVKLEPKTWLAQARLGDCHLDLGDYGAAIAAFKKANAFQETSGSHVAIGRALLALNKRAEAFESFERAAAIDPGSAWVVHESRARVERTEGRPEAAVVSLARAVEAATLPAVRSQLTDDLVALCLEIGDFPRAAALYGDRRWIGITITPDARGFEIAGVVKNGPADLAGLSAGDVIVEFEGRSLAGADRSLFPGEMLGSVPHGGTAGLTIERQGRRIEKSVVVGLSPDLPLRAREAAGGKTAAPPPSPAATEAPTIAITGLAVEPESVPAGGDFAVDIGFTVTVPSGPADLPVTLTCEISQDGRTVYEPEPAAFEAPNGSPFEVSRKLSAGPRGGAYTVRVRLAWMSLSAERSVDFTIK